MGVVDGDEPLPAGLRAGRMLELEQVDQEAADLADDGVATVTAHVLDLLRQVLEVERTVPTFGELAERCGLLPCPGVEVAIVKVGGCRAHRDSSVRPWRLAGSQLRSRSWSSVQGQSGGSVRAASVSPCFASCCWAM